MKKERATRQQKVLSGAAKITLLVILFAIIFAGTLSGAFGIENFAMEKGLTLSKTESVQVADAQPNHYTAATNNQSVLDGVTSGNMLQEYTVPSSEGLKAGMVSTENDASHTWNTSGTSLDSQTANLAFSTNRVGNQWKVSYMWISYKLSADAAALLKAGSLMFRLEGNYLARTCNSEWAGRSNLFVGFVPTYGGPFAFSQSATNDNVTKHFETCKGNGDDSTYGGAYSLKGFMQHGYGQQWQQGNTYHDFTEHGFVINKDTQARGDGTKSAIKDITSGDIYINIIFSFSIIQNSPSTLGWGQIFANPIIKSARVNANANYFTNTNTSGSNALASTAGAGKYKDGSNYKEYEYNLEPLMCASSGQHLSKGTQIKTTADNSTLSYDSSNKRWSTTSTDSHFVYVPVKLSPDIYNAWKNGVPISVEFICYIQGSAESEPRIYQIEPNSSNIRTSTLTDGHAGNVAGNDWPCIGICAGQWDRKTRWAKSTAQLPATTRTTDTIYVGVYAKGAVQLSGMGIKFYYNATTTYYTTVSGQGRSAGINQGGAINITLQAGSNGSIQTNNETLSFEGTWYKYTRTATPDANYVFNTWKVGSTSGSEWNTVGLTDSDKKSVKNANTGACNSVFSGWNITPGATYVAEFVASDFDFLNSNSRNNWGTANNPFVISSETHFNNLMKIVNNDSSFTITNGLSNNGIAGVTSYARTYNGCYFIVTQNITISSTSFRVGTDSTNCFSGNIYGGTSTSTKTNKTITISLEGTSSANFTGLFGYAKNATIEYLTTAGNFRGSDTSGDGRATGALVGCAQNCTISHCFNTANTDGATTNYRIGGLVGYMNGGTISNCGNSGNIKGVWRVGGIVASCQDNAVTISHCYNSGNLSVENNNNGGNICGGIVGITTVNATISYCVNTGTITYNPSNTSNGGILAQINNTPTVTISYCYNTGYMGGNSTGTNSIAPSSATIDHSIAIKNADGKFSTGNGYFLLDAVGATVAPGDNNSWCSWTDIVSRNINKVKLTFAIDPGKYLSISDFSDSTSSITSHATDHDNAAFNLEVVYNAGAYGNKTVTVKAVDITSNPSASESHSKGDMVELSVSAPVLSASAYTVNYYYVANGTNKYDVNGGNNTGKTDSITASTADMNANNTYTWMFDIVYGGVIVGRAFVPYIIIASSDFGVLPGKNRGENWGSINNPYVISSNDHLLTLANIVNGTSTIGDSGNSTLSGDMGRGIAASTDYAGCYFVIIVDLDFTTEQNFKVIGGEETSATNKTIRSDNKYKFAGNIAGFDVEYYEDHKDDTGFDIVQCYALTTVNMGSISKNNKYCSSSDWNIGFIGYMKAGSVQYIKVEGTITSSGGNCGGIVGHITGDQNIIIAHCVSNVTINNSGQCSGGIIASAESSSAATITVSNCYNMGEVKSSDVLLGGIVGKADGGCRVDILYCYNAGVVTRTSDKSSGILGHKGGGSTTVTVDHCYNSAQSTQMHYITNASDVSLDHNMAFYHGATYTWGTVNFAYVNTSFLSVDGRTVKLYGTKGVAPNAENVEFELSTFTVAGFDALWLNIIDANINGIEITFPAENGKYLSLSHPVSKDNIIEYGTNDRVGIKVEGGDAYPANSIASDGRLLSIGLGTITPKYQGIDNFYYFNTRPQYKGSLYQLVAELANNLSNSSVSNSVYLTDGTPYKISLVSAEYLNGSGKQYTDAGTYRVKYEMWIGTNDIDKKLVGYAEADFTIDPMQIDVALCFDGVGQGGITGISGTNYINLPTDANANTAYILAGQSDNGKNYISTENFKLVHAFKASEDDDDWDYTWFDYKTEFVVINNGSSAIFEDRDSDGVSDGVFDRIKMSTDPQSVAVKVTLNNKNYAVNSNPTFYCTLVSGDYARKDGGTGVWGSATNPYVISNEFHLQRFAGIINGTSNPWNSVNGINGTTGVQANNSTYAGAYFELSSDITAPNGFVSIGGHSENENTNKMFAGTFDGKNHKITYTYNGNQRNYCGLFGKVKGTDNDNHAVIKDLQVDATLTVSAANNYWVGGVVGWLEYADLNNVSATVSIVKTGGSCYNTGGLVGKAINSTITNCKVSVKVAGININVGANVGGIVGETENTTLSFNGTISFNGTVVEGAAVEGTGSIHGENYVGGLVGKATNTTIKTTAETTINLVDIQIVGGNYVGGLVGHWIVSDASQVNNVHNEGEDEVRHALTWGRQSSNKVTGTSFVGGLVGYFDASGVTSGDPLIINGELTPGSNARVTVEGQSFVGGLYGVFIGSGYMANNVKLGAHDTIISLDNLTGDSGSIRTTVKPTGNAVAVGGLFGYIAKAGVYFEGDYNGVASLFDYTGATTVSVLGMIAGIIGDNANLCSVARPTLVGGALTDGTAHAIYIDGSQDSPQGRVTGVLNNSSKLKSFIGAIAGHVSASAGIYNGSSTDRLFGNNVQLKNNAVVNAGGNQVGGLFGAMGRADTSDINTLKGYITLADAKNLLESAMNATGYSMTYGPRSVDFGTNTIHQSISANLQYVTGVNNVGGIVGAVYDGACVDFVNPIYTEDANVDAPYLSTGEFNHTPIYSGDADGAGSDTNGTIKITGTSYVGGIVGYLGAGNNKLQYVVYRGQVGNSWTEGTYVGGLVGFMENGTILNSAATPPRAATALGPNSSVPTPIQGVSQVGGIAGGVEHGVITNCISFGIKYDGFAKTNVDVGGIVGYGGQNAIITNSWAIYSAENPTYASTVANPKGNWIILDKEYAYLPSYAEVLTAIGLYNFRFTDEGADSGSVANNKNFKDNDVLRAVPGQLSLGMKLDTLQTNKQFVIYTATGSPTTSQNNFSSNGNLLTDDKLWEAMKDTTKTFEEQLAMVSNLNNVFRLRIDVLNGMSSFSICVTDVVFKDIPAPATDDDNGRNAAAAAGYRAPNGDSNYYAAVTSSTFSGTQVTGIVANIKYRWVDPETHIEYPVQVGAYNKTFTLGDDTSPFIISNQSQWDDYAEMIMKNSTYTSGGTTYYYRSANYKLTTDSIRVEYKGSNFKSDGNTNGGYNLFGQQNASSAVFIGNFDGNGHYITVNIDANNYEDGYGHFSGISVFANAGAATIRNLTIKGTLKQIKNGVTGTKDTSDGAANVGAFVGVARGAVKIYNCVNETNVSARKNVGGFVGNGGTHNITVQSCVNKGTITSYEEPTFSGNSIGADNKQNPTDIGTGGIIGRAQGTLNIDSCLNMGFIQGKVNVGGIIGTLYATGTSNSEKGTLAISNCGNEGVVHSNMVTNVSNKSTETGMNVWAHTGGLVGTVNQYVELIIYRSYNSGTVSAVGNCVGGLVGTVGSFSSGDYKPMGVSTNYTATIRESFNSGDIHAGVDPGDELGTSSILKQINADSGWGRYTGTCVGGLVGDCASARVADCYNAGMITSWGGQGNTTNKFRCMVGGLFGFTASSDKRIVIFSSFNIGLIRRMSNHDSWNLGGAGFIGYIESAGHGYADAFDCFSLKNQFYYESRSAYYNESEGDSKGYHLNESRLYNSSTHTYEDAQYDTSLPLYQYTAYVDDNGNVTLPSTALYTALKSSRAGRILNYKTEDLWGNGYGFSGESPWVLVPGCTPQLACFVLSTPSGLSMSSVSFGRNQDGDYATDGTIAGTSEDNPLIIEDGIQLAALSQIVNAGRLLDSATGQVLDWALNWRLMSTTSKSATYTDDFAGLYVAFANGTNNLKGIKSAYINLPTSDAQIPSDWAAFKASSDGTNFTYAGKTYHTLVVGAAGAGYGSSANQKIPDGDRSDAFTNWKDNNHYFDGETGTYKNNATISKTFVPIGFKGESKIFKGHITGVQYRTSGGEKIYDQNTVIKNLKISVGAEKYAYGGLFSRVEDGYVGYLTTAGTINAYAKATSGRKFVCVGGVVADVTGASTIEHCYAGASGLPLTVCAYSSTNSKTDDVNNLTTYVGGVVGVADTSRYRGGNYVYDNNTTTRIVDCQAVNVTVNSRKNNIGGIVGYVCASAFESNNNAGGESNNNAGGKNNYVYVTNCHVKNAVINALATSNEYAGVNIGGIVGLADNYVVATISNCVVGNGSVGSDYAVKISGKNTVGGIISATPKGAVRIESCTVYGDVLISDSLEDGTSPWGTVYNHDTYGTAIGGFVGYTPDHSASHTTFAGNNRFDGLIKIIHKHDTNGTQIINNVGGLVGYVGTGTSFERNSTFTVGGYISINGEGQCGANSIGGLIGYQKSDLAFSGTYTVTPTLMISNCTSKNALGGFIGKNEGTVALLYDKTTITIGRNGTKVGYDISGTTNIGGFVGHNTSAGSIKVGPDTGYGTIGSYLENGLNINIHLAVSGSGDNIGGFIGLNEGAVNIQKGNIQISSYAQITGNNNVGGIIGNNNATLAVGDSAAYHEANQELFVIKNSGNVSGNDKVGGVIGALNAGAVSGKYVNVGTVSGVQYVGGIIGFMAAGTSIVTQVGPKIVETTFTNGSPAARSSSDEALVAAEGAGGGGTVTGLRYVGGSIGAMRGTIDGDATSRVQFINYGNLVAYKDPNNQGIRYAGGNIGLMSGTCDYVIFSNRTASFEVQAEVAVGGSIGYIGIAETTTAHDAIAVRNTHFEFEQGYMFITGGTTEENHDFRGGIGGVIGILGRFYQAYSGSGNQTPYKYVDNKLPATAWSNVTFYSEGNVEAANHDNVGGIIGYIRQQGVTISDTLAYHTKVVGSANVGGIVGGIEAASASAVGGAYTSILNSYYISNPEGENSDYIYSNAGGSGEKYLGGIIGKAYFDGTGNVVTGAGATDASTSYWVRGESNALLEKVDANNLSTSFKDIGFLTFRTSDPNAAGTPTGDFDNLSADVLLPWTYFELAESSLTEIGPFKADGSAVVDIPGEPGRKNFDVYNLEDEQYIGWFYTELKVEFHRVWNDETQESKTATIRHKYAVLFDFMAGQYISAGKMPYDDTEGYLYNESYMFQLGAGAFSEFSADTTWDNLIGTGWSYTTANGNYVFDGGNVRYTTGTNQTGWFYIYSYDYKVTEGAGKVDAINALHTSITINGAAPTAPNNTNDAQNKAAWKRIANAYTTEERKAGLDTAVLRSAIVYDADTDKGSVQEGYVYATARPGEDGYYLYMAVTGRNAALPVLQSKGDELYYFNVNAQPDENPVQNILIFYRKMQVKSSIIYNGYDRTVPVSDTVLKGKQSATTESAIADSELTHGYAYVDTTAQQLYKHVGTYTSTVGVYYSGLIVGKPGTGISWRIAQKEVVASLDRTNGGVYGDTTAKAITLTVSGFAQTQYAEAGEFGGALSVVVAITWKDPNSKEDKAVNLTVTSTGGNASSLVIDAGGANLTALGITIDTESALTAADKAYGAAGAEFTARNQYVDSSTTWSKMYLKFKFRDVANYKVTVSFPSGSAYAGERTDYKLTQKETEVQIRPAKLTITGEGRTVMYNGQYTTENNKTNWTIAGWRGDELADSVKAVKYIEALENNGIKLMFKPEGENAWQEVALTGSGEHPVIGQRNGSRISLERLSDAGTYALWIKSSGTISTAGGDATTFTLSADGSKLYIGNYYFEISSSAHNINSDHRTVDEFTISRVKMVVTSVSKPNGGTHVYNGTTRGYIEISFQIQDTSGTAMALTSVYEGIIDDYYKYTLAGKNANESAAIPQNEVSTSGNTRKVKIYTGLYVANYKVNVTDVGDTERGREIKRNCAIDSGNATKLANLSYSITAAPLWVTFTMEGGKTSYEYDGVKHGVTSVTINGLVNNEIASLSYAYAGWQGIGASLTISPASGNTTTGTSATMTGNTTDVGSYTLTINGINSASSHKSNYTLTTVTKEWHITPRTLNLSTAGGTYVYDGQEHNPTLTATGTVTGETVEINYAIVKDTQTVAKAVNVGTYSIAYTSADITVKKGASTTGVNGGLLKNNYAITGASSNTVSVTITPAQLALVWTDTSLVYTGSSQGARVSQVKVMSGDTVLATYNVTNGAFNGYNNVLNGSADDLALTYTGKQTNVGDNYTMTAALDTSKPQHSNYQIASGSEQAYVITKATITIGSVSIADESKTKVYDGTTSVAGGTTSVTVNWTCPTYTVQASDFTITSVAFNDEDVLDANSIIVNITINNANLNCTTALPIVVDGCSITPKNVEVILNKLRSDKATKVFDNTKWYGGEEGFVNGGNGHSRIYRSGEGFIVEGFVAGDSVGVKAWYEEVLADRSAFNFYINDVYNDNGTVKKATSGTYFKQLVFDLYDTDNGTDSTNYTFSVVKSRNGEALATGTSSTNAIVKDKRADGAGNIVVEITVNSFRANYANTMQSYVKDDNSYNTYWEDVAATNVPAGITIDVTNGWKLDGTNAKEYHEYTVIKGNANSAILGANIHKDDAGMYLNYRLQNQPTLTIGYFISGDVFNINSLATLMIASYYQAASTPEFNLEIIKEWTWVAIVGNDGYNDSAAWTTPSNWPAGYPTKDDATSWDDFFASLEESKGVNIFLNVNEGNSWGFYVENAESTQASKIYKQYVQIDNVSGILTDADITVLNGFFRKYVDGNVVAADWGAGVGTDRYVSQFSVKLGSVTTLTDAIFNHAFGDGYSFDGNGYKIDHFNMVVVGENVTVGGLVNNVTSGLIKNVNLRNFNIFVQTTSGTVKLGGIAGEATTVNAIANSTFHGSIQAVAGTGSTLYVGGVYGSGSTALDGVITLGNIDVNAKGTSYVGGVAGSSTGAISNAVSMIEILARVANANNVKPIANGTHADTNVTFMANSAWAKVGGTLSSVSATGGKTYTELMAGSNTGYGNHNYYSTEQTGRGTYDVIENIDARYVSTATAPRESLRLKDIVKVYLLMFTLNETSAFEFSGNQTTAYDLNGNSWLVGSADGTDTNRISIANQQGVAMLRELRFASFTLTCDVTMYSTFADVYEGAFYGNVNATGSAKIDLVNVNSLFESQSASLTAVIVQHS